MVFDASTGPDSTKQRKEQITTKMTPPNLVMIYLHAVRLLKNKI